MRQETTLTNQLLDGHKRMNLQTIDGIANSFSVITSTLNKMFRIKTNGYDMSEVDLKLIVLDVLDV